MTRKQNVLYYLFSGIFVVIVVFAVCCVLTYFDFDQTPMGDD